jgi:hypothetical protein
LIDGKERLVKKSKKSKKAAPYVRRALEDERVHDHHANAAAAARKAYDRAAGQRGTKAVEDKKVYDHVRNAAGSARAAILAVRRPPPPPPKRRGRKLMLVVLVAAAAVIVAKRVKGADDVRDTSDRAPEPVEPGRSADPGRSAAKEAAHG